MAYEETEWFEVSLSTDEIMLLSEDERYVLFMGGHIANELSALIKLSLDLGINAPREKFANAHYTTISIFLIFVGSGKIREAWKVINDLVEASSFQKDFADHITSVGANALQQLKKYFKDYKQTSITKTRDEIGFHYPSRKTFRDFLATNSIDQESLFQILLSETEVNNSYISSAHLLYQFAGSHTNQEDHVHGLKTLIDEQVETISLLIRLVNELIAVVLKRKFPSTIESAFKDTKTHEIQRHSEIVALPVLASKHLARISK